MRRLTRPSWPIALILGSGFAFAELRADDFESRMDSLIQRAMPTEFAPGIAVAVVRDEAIVYLKGHGLADLESQRPVRTDTGFYIASSTKSFLGLAAALLHDRGDIPLDAALGDYLPEVTLHPSLKPESITLESLLTHTHGIANDGPVTFRTSYTGQFDDTLLQSLLKHHGPDERGTDFHYGNIGYNIAGLALAAETQQGWKEILEEEIFSPLSLQSTTAYASRFPPERLAMPYRPLEKGFERIPYGKTDENMHAAGGLITTAEDVARWLLANINSGVLDGKQVLSRAAFEDAHRPRAEQSGRFRAYHRTGYGLGWNTGHYDDDVYLHHFGGFVGFHAHIGFLPEQKIGVAVLANCSQGLFLADLVARQAYDTLLGKSDVEGRMNDVLEECQRLMALDRDSIAKDRARRAQRPRHANQAWEAYAGRYENPLFGEVILSVVDGELRGKMGVMEFGIEVYDAGRDALRFDMAGRGRVAFFSFPEAGEAVSFEEGGQVYRRTGS